MSEVKNTAMAGDSQFSHALQDDGREHPRGDSLAYICLALGVVTLVLAIAEVWDIATIGHVIGVLTGLVGFLISMYAQMTSATTRERWILMPGWILAGTFGAVNFYFAVT
jgi:hypothetical protein